MLSFGVDVPVLYLRETLFVQSSALCHVQYLLLTVQFLNNELNCDFCRFLVLSYFSSECCCSSPVLPAGGAISSCNAILGSDFSLHKLEGV